MNGLLLDLTADYTSNGSAVTLTSGAAVGDEIEVVAYNTFSVGDALNQAPADTRYVNTTGDDSMTGNFGIGTSTPNAYSGYTTLTLDHATNGGVIDIERNGNLVGELLTDNANTLSMSAFGARAINLKTNSTERMHIDSAGRVTKPTQPSFMIKGSSGSKNIASGAAVASGMYNPTVWHNVGNHLNTSNAIFTAPVTGKYYIEWTAYTQTTGGLKNEYVAVYLNFSNIGAVYGFHECGPDVSAQISGVFGMSANDSVTPYTYGHGSRTQSYLGQHSYYSGYLLG
jgi:hypothetical protein